MNKASPPYVPFNERFPLLPPVSIPVADVEDALNYPEINRAIDHARAKRKGR